MRYINLLIHSLTHRKDTVMDLTKYSVNVTPTPVRAEVYIRPSFYSQHAYASFNYEIQLVRHLFSTFSGHSVGHQNDTATAPERPEAWLPLLLLKR